MLLPGLVALCNARPRSLHACSDPQSPVAIRACSEGPQALEGAGRLLFGAGLDPNRATAEELTLLPGIGPARAAAIVAERTRRPFQRPEEIERVHGIGPRTVDKLRPWLQIEPAIADPYPSRPSSGSGVQ
jgi:competence protein ComEA